MQLYPHQQEALDWTEKYNRVAYYYDMGLGKTYIGSEKMIQLGEIVNLVICQKSKIKDWMEHFQQNYPQVWVFDLTNPKKYESYVEECKFCQMLIKNSTYGNKKFHSPMVGIVNYDLVFRRSYFAQMTGFTLMLDESSIIQNESAKRSKFILKMKPDNVILLSGTPTAGKYERLWSQLHLLGWDISKERYWQHYVETEWIEDHESGFKIQHVIGYKNVDRLKAKLAEHGAIFMKSDEAFELPEQVEIPMMIETSREYRKFMRNDLVTVKKFDDFETEVELNGDTTLTKRLYARQLCGQYSRQKLQAFEDLIFSTSERLIVFYNFNEELNLLEEIAMKRTTNISIIRGEEKNLEAYTLYDDSITFVQYQAGAMGLNLQLANRIVYFTLPERSELFEQSKKRIHRIGQEKTCFYYYLLCRNSIETDILKNLKMRKDYTDDLFKTYTENK